MDDATPNLHLPYIMAAQAQKHVTHNEAIRALDAVVQLAVLDRDLTVPPAAPTEGARYVVAAAASGAWAGHVGAVAAWQDGAWAFYAPREGWVAWIADEDVLVAWNGTVWVTAGGSPLALNPVTGGVVGIATTADATNRLAVSAPACLFTHAGAGHQLKVNKNVAGDTASLLLQTGFSGRAEVGLAGDDRLRIKVSANGSTWRDALVVDSATGAVSLPRGFDSTAIVIAKDAVGIVPTPSAGGLTMISLVHPTFPQAQFGCLLSYDTGSSPSLQGLAVGTQVTVGGTAVPTGTTGTDGRVSVFANGDGNLRIENRYGTAGSSNQFSITFFNGFRSL
jgi:hypothetical protein